jgi:hypothetical protein
MRQPLCGKKTIKITIISEPRAISASLANRSFRNRQLKLFHDSRRQRAFSKETRFLCTLCYPSKRLGSGVTILFLVIINCKLASTEELAIVVYTSANRGRILNTNNKTAATQKGKPAKTDMSQRGGHIHRRRYIRG